MSNNLEQGQQIFSPPCVFVEGPVIIGAGPSGLAVAAGLKQQGIPFTILERTNCIASLWQNRTYDRLKLHLPKKFCQLPYLPFPQNYPEYPTRNQFVEYLNSYAEKFEINPSFNESVQSATYDKTCGLWEITSLIRKGDTSFAAKYMCRWIVVATGENAEKVVPQFEGLEDFGGLVMHASEYKSGEDFEGENVLVVGCGNSGMEISLDLANHKATPYMAVRSSVHVMPMNIFGTSTFGLAAMMMKWLPIWMVDKFLLGVSRLMFGNLEKFGLKRPSIGPLQFKDRAGKTPVLDTGTVTKIRTGEIKIVPAIEKFSLGMVELVSGQNIHIDSVILATGYTSNVPSWLEENEFFSEEGIPVAKFPNGWKGKTGIYAVGFSRKGLSGASFDAMKVSEDIGQIWKEEKKQSGRGIHGGIAGVTYETPHI